MDAAAATSEDVARLGAELGGQCRRDRGTIRRLHAMKGPEALVHAVDQRRSPARLPDGSWVTKLVATISGAEVETPARSSSASASRKNLRG